MSNTAVGPCYQNIIDEVISSSRVDFEENGVEELVLDELRMVWQAKLSQLGVASFPWDPRPEPPPPAQQPQQQVAPAGHSQAQFSPTALGNAPQNGIKQEPGLEPQIKQEPGTQQQPMLPTMNLPPDNKNNVAANRAAHLVQQQYGNRAVNSISALHQGQQGMVSPQPQMPQPEQPGQPMNLIHQPLYQQQQQQQQQQPMQDQLSSIQQAQTDGTTDDFEAILMRRSQAGELIELGRTDIDKLLHEHIASNAKAMEGGGLMLPLKQARRTRTAGIPDRKGKGVAAHDGGDEEDEDAINSDLDDPDDDQADEDDDDELGHIMLCMYDKVQRVKNKWKCTLKDGVLTVNGKEYVFHKATGEYEW